MIELANKKEEKSPEEQLKILRSKKSLKDSADAENWAGTLIKAGVIGKPLKIVADISLTEPLKITYLGTKGKIKIEASWVTLKLRKNTKLFKLIENS